MSNKNREFIGSENELFKVRNQVRGLAAALLTTALVGMSASFAYAQDSEESGGILDEIIVTGTAAGQKGITKFESSLSSTTFDEDALREIGSSNTAGIFASVPGVWAEDTGGGSGNNVFIRGIPAGGAFTFSKINVDGLPLIEEQGNFVNPDGLFKQDLTISRLEAIRGGSSGVFASNSPGGLFNFISKKGSDEFEGILKVEGATYDYLRTDLFLSGPLNDKTTYTLGGFYRSSEGVRDAGFRGDEGGQIKGSLTRELDKGEFTVRASWLDDKNIFYLPFTADIVDGELASFPGIDALRGTNVTDDARFLSIVQPGGNVDINDSADGIHNKAVNFGTELIYDIGSDWTLTNRNRYTDSSWDANLHIIFGGAEGQSVVDGFLGAAQAAFGPEVTNLSVRYLEDGVGSTSTFNFSGAGNAGANGNGFIYTQALFAWDSASTNFVNDFSLAKSFETSSGTHNFAIGNYISQSSYEVFNQTPLFLTEVASSPRLLNVFANDANGNVLGAVTQNGVSSYGCCGGLLAANYEVDTDILAFYATDDWEVNDKFRVDGSFRYERQSFSGSVEQDAAFDVSADNPLTGATGLETLADDNVVFGTGVFTPFEVEQNEIAWSLGANYILQDWVSAYARISDGTRTPDVNFLANAARANPGNASQAASDLPVNTLLQYEGGFKIDVGKLQAFITPYYTDFQDQVAAIAAPMDANGNPINVQPLLSAKTLGLETEVEIGPFNGFSVNAKATFQDPELASLSFIGPDAANVPVAASGTVEGNQVPRIPKTIFTIQPKYEFDLNEDLDGSLYVKVFHVGDRFADFGNSVLIPAYTTVGAGWQLNYGNVTFEGVIENLTNQIGFTEGNPRADLLGSGSGPTIASIGRSVHGRNARFSLAYKF